MDSTKPYRDLKRKQTAASARVAILAFIAQFTQIIIMAEDQLEA